MKIAALAIGIIISIVAIACGGSGSSPSGQGDSAKGKTLASSNGCAGCHSADGSKNVGPTFKGLYGSTVELSSGASVTADDAYLRESIVDPNSKISKGFSSGLMPQNFGQRLSAQDITDIIAYIKTLQ